LLQSKVVKKKDHMEQRTKRGNVKYRPKLKVIINNPMENSKVIEQERKVELDLPQDMTLSMEEKMLLYEWACRNCNRICSDDKVYDDPLLVIEWDQSAITARRNGQPQIAIPAPPPEVEDIVAAAISGVIGVSRIGLPPNQSRTMFECQSDQVWFAAQSQIAGLLWTLRYAHVQFAPLAKLWFIKAVKTTPGPPEVICSFVATPFNT
jgi:hypothetical protein